MKHRHSCPYCHGRAFCSDRGKCEFPQTTTVEGDIYLTYDPGINSALPWHPDARCIKCDRQVDCLACGDQHPISPLEQLAEEAE